MAKPCFLALRDTPVMTFAKKTPILGSLSGETRGWLRLVGEGAGKWGDPAVRCRGCVCRAVCAALLGNSPAQGNPWASPAAITAPRRAAALLTPAPGDSPACSITQALPKPGASLGDTAGWCWAELETKSCGGRALSVHSAFPPASSLHGCSLDCHRFGKSPASPDSVTPAGFGHSCCFLADSDDFCSFPSTSCLFIFALIILGVWGTSLNWTWGCWWTTSWPRASSVPLLPRRPMASWGALRRVRPAGQGRFFSPSTLP